MSAKVTSITTDENNNIIANVSLGASSNFKFPVKNKYVDKNIIVNLDPGNTVTGNGDYIFNIASTSGGETGSAEMKISTAALTHGNDVGTIEFSVEGKPAGWTIIQTSESRDWAYNTPFICLCDSFGNCASLVSKSNYGYIIVTPNNVTSTYNNKVLTVNLISTTSSGPFRGEVQYQLNYVI